MAGATCHRLMARRTNLGLNHSGSSRHIGCLGARFTDSPTTDSRARTIAMESSLAPSHLEILRANLTQVRRRIEEACVRSGRQAADVSLVAVTKTVAPPVIRALVDLGQRVLAENRLQVGGPKVEALADLDA